ncbi:MAG: hypothetical protein ABL957_00370 [Parvularculaceae bacterium]
MRDKGANVASYLIVRLRNLARDRNVDMQFMRRRYAIERLLARPGRAPALVGDRVSGGLPPAGRSSGRAIRPHRAVEGIHARSLREVLEQRRIMGIPKFVRANGINWELGRLGISPDSPPTTETRCQICVLRHKWRKIKRSVDLAQKKAQNRDSFLIFSFAPYIAHNSSINGL